MRVRRHPVWAQFFTVIFLGAITGAITPQNPAPNAASNSKTSNSEPATGERRSPDYQDDAWRVLSLGLKHRKAAQRVEAVKALSLMQGNRRAVTFALRALNDKDSRVRAAAAGTLGELHATQAIPALRSALSDKDASVVLTAAYALFVLKDSTAYEIYYAILMGDKKTSAGLIQAQVDRLKDPKQVVEMGLQEGMGFVPFGGMGYEAYRMLMKHDNSPVRATAARYLARDPDPMSEDALIQTALVDKKAIVREASLDALSQRDDPKCIERLAANLGEKMYAVRYRTAATIIHLGRMKSNASSD